MALSVNFRSMSLTVPLVSFDPLIQGLGETKKLSEMTMMHKLAKDSMKAVIDIPALRLNVKKVGSFLVNLQIFPVTNYFALAGGPPPIVAWTFSFAAYLQLITMHLH